MKRHLAIAVTIAATVALTGCQLAPKTSTQNGYRGTGMDTIKVSNAAAAQEVPAPPYDPPGLDGERASAVYQNVKVLGGVSADQFNYTMAALTQWVAPEEGCNYCHNPANMASDEKYTKVVARRMIQMTQAINSKWSNHVGQTGVTCWTCHRGQAVPTEHWSLPAVAQSKGAARLPGWQDKPTSNSSYSSLPTNAVALYLLGGVSPDTNIRVVSKYAHRVEGAPHVSTMESEPTYGLMMHISSSLGVNCTYCHNAQSFQQWAISNPPRQTAYYGIRMVRDINGSYIGSLANVFPANRKGEMGDVLKANCATCHRGQNKPLGGYPMAHLYPAIYGKAAPAGVSLVPAPETTPNPVAIVGSPETTTR
jgi:photosynthetic reaction center cytochrome c subunit